MMCQSALRPIVLSSPVTTPSRCAPMGGFAQSLAGMEGLSFLVVPLQVHHYDELSDLIRIRLFSTKSMKPLGTLQYHKEACQSLAFANPVNQSSDVTEDNDDSDDEMTLEEKNQRSHWLVTGGGDKKVAIWALTDFTKP